MTDVIGVELVRAIEILEKQGYKVETLHLKSNKAKDIDTILVVRQKLLENTIFLVASGFKQEI